MKKGLLLINLGSPDHPTTPAVRKYLRQFLMDRHVIDVHWSWRSFLVHAIIAPTRAPKSAHAYQSVWTNQGSPLLVFSQAFANRVSEALPETRVELGMRYGKPSVLSALEKLRASDIDQLDVVPLYPQFAKSSTLTAIEASEDAIRKMGWKIERRYLQDFFEADEWTRNLAANISAEIKSFRPDFLLASYHGLPEHHVREFDRSGQHCLKKDDCCASVQEVNRRCYRAQCYATTRAFARHLDWPKEKLKVSFQSRLGRQPWIQPYTDFVAVDLAKKGVKRLLVTCPSFVADCLETLEEIAIRLKTDFIQAGGEDLKLVPAVNSEDGWVRDFTQLVKRSDLTWLTP